MPTPTLRSADWLHQTLGTSHSDRDLLARFDAGDEGAFAELVRRHGPMVLGVCERVLGNRDDAEDAYQSTFLELAKHASRADWRESLSGWLHDVAWRVANRQRRRLSRQRRQEREVHSRPANDKHADPPAALDEELRQLPVALREAVLCCYFQGLTRQQAADKLGLSLRTLERRLEEGKRRLRQRLEARGQPIPVLLGGSAFSLSSYLGRWWLVAGLVLVTGAGLAARPRALESDSANSPSAASAAAPATAESPLPPHAVARLGQTKFVGGFMINHVCYSPDGKILASGGNGRGLCLWEATTGKLLHHCTTRSFPSTYSAAFSPDGRRVVTTDGNPVVVWDVATGKNLLELKGHTNGVLTVAWADNGKWIASGSHDATVRVWDADTGKQLHSLAGHDKLPRQVAFSPGSKLLASASLDLTVRVWDPATGKELHCLKGATKELHALAFSPDGATLAWTGEDGDVRVWPTDGKSPVRTLVKGGGDGWSVAFSPDSQTLASGWRDGSVRLTDTRTGKELRRWHAGVFSVYSLAYSPDGKTLASGGTWGSAVRRWDPATGKEIEPGTGHAGPVDRLLFTRGDEALLSFGRDHRVIRWDLSTRAPTATAIPQYGSFVTGAFSPDGKLVALAGRKSGRKSGDTAIKIHDTATGARVREIEGYEGYAIAVAFSRDGKRLASAGQDNTLRVWNVGDGKQVWVDEDRGRRGAFIVPLHFSPDDRLLLYAGVERKVRLFDAATGKTLHEYDAGDGVHGAAFSPDGKLAALVGGYGNQAIVLWDTATGKVARSWHSGQSGLHNAAFSPDGRLLATAGDDVDSTVKLWDVVTSQELAHFKGHHSAVLSLAFSRDGQTLASGGGDASVLLWDVTGRKGKPNGALTAKKLQELWHALADEDAKKAHAAAWELALTPDGAVPFLRDRLAPVKAAEAAAVDRLVTQLGADEFALRQTATAELERLGARAVPRLRQVLDGKPDLEVRKRVEAVLSTYDRSDEWHRGRLALAVLERGGSAAARKLIAELARGAAGAPLTEEARAVRRRTPTD